MSDEEVAGLKRGPKPKGETPMTGAERNRLYRQRKKRREAEANGRLPSAFDVLEISTLWSLETAESLIEDARREIEKGSDKKIPLHSLKRTVEVLGQIKLAISEIRDGEFPSYSGVKPGTDKRFQRP